MGENKNSLLIILNHNLLDIHSLFTESSDIPSSLYLEVNTINVLLDFTIEDPYELDYFLNLLYTLIREKVEYTVDINVLFKNKDKSDDTRFSSLLKTNKHIFVPTGYSINEAENINYYNPLKLKQKINYEYENKEGNNKFEYKSFKISAVGGTFDHLHDGHKILLALCTFLTFKKLIIGLTSEKLLVNKKFKQYLQPFEERRDEVLKFVELLDSTLEYDILPISDVCGPTGYEPNIELLIVSEETKSGGDFVNKTRSEKGLSQLSIFVVNVLGGKEKLSSTYLRQLESEKKL
ncbi:Nucleotidylyl transferase [Hanseniaspora valbyensis NRRL Y-1626]|uniref:Nucleotidylyl transferase n=1 Tax=Hanseniaspora valbyensis NRRL Y-1626 TaxID=766949 RepID=A0A1B7TJN4_9ASCO|nr:Nucleotidylyl transferase [Hanseniaspora valbyensis NRRL Y-1626]